MKFGSTTQPPKAKGKSSRSQMLPSRHAVNTLVKGTPFQRSMSNYAKLTPSGAGAPAHYQTIIDMAEAALPVDPKR